MDDARLRNFLADSLALWGVAGEVRLGQGAVLAVIASANGARVWIERAAHDMPFRWLVRWRAPDAQPGGVREVRPRVCASLVGLLAALREALGVERGAAVRIVAAPEAS